MSWARVRKPVVSAFIAVCLITQILQNMAIGYPVGPETSPYPVRLAAWVVAEVRWGFDTFGFYTGTNTLWRMFSPVHKYEWSWAITAIYADGSMRALPSPSDPATDPAPFFVDFRETKLLLNLWTRPPMQAAYADHLCRHETARGVAPQRVRLDLEWRAIVPPEVAASTGSHLADRTNSQAMGEFACSGQAAR